MPIEAGRSREEESRTPAAFGQDRLRTDPHRNGQELDGQAGDRIRPNRFPGLWGRPRYTISASQSAPVSGHGGQSPKVAGDAAT